MADLTHSFAHDTTLRTSTSSTWVDITTSVQISGTDLTGGNDYIIFASCTAGGSDASSPNFEYRVVENGVGQLAGAYQRNEPPDNSTLAGQPFGYMGKVTAAATPNDYRLQVQTTGTVRVGNLAMLAFDLTQLGATNYAYDEDTTSYTTVSSSSPITGASVTVGDGTSDYMVWGYVHAIADSASTSSVQVWIDDGSTTPTLADMEADDVEDVFCILVARYYPAVASSTTFTLKIDTDSTTDTHWDVDRNQIFALKLNAFEDHFGKYDGGPYGSFTLDTTVVAINQTHTTNTAGARNWQFIGYATNTVGSGLARTRYDLNDSGLGVIAGGIVDATDVDYASSSTTDRINAHLMGKKTSVANSTSLSVDMRSQRELNTGGSNSNSSLAGWSWEFSGGAANTTIEVPTGPLR